MRILYLSDNLSNHNRLFLESLALAGIEVRLLDPTHDCIDQSWLPHGVHWVPPRERLSGDADPAAFAGFVTEFRDLLQDLHPDLIHAGPTHSCGYLAALANFHPWVLMSWGSDILYYPDRNPDWKQATQIALASADGFFCDCDAVRDAAKRIADIPDERIAQFPWGIKQGVFTPSGPLPRSEELAREPGTFELLCTRSWEPLYAIDVLLKAFHQAYRINSNLRLLLLGDGSEAPRVHQYIRTHRLGQVVRTRSHVRREDMPRWFRAADAYVSCAQSDGTSVSLLEAMATGLPVIASDIPSNREWITEDVNGWLVSPGSAEEFADRCLRVAGLSAEQRNYISERNRHIVEERADWDRNFPELLRLYERLTGMQIGSAGIAARGLLEQAECAAQEIK
jgi:L-malate glycosyltransferase